MLHQSVEAARPAFYTSPRLEFTKAKYLEASIRAKVLGDDESRQYVLAADDTTTNNSGLIPTRQLTEIVNPLSNADRPIISAISSGVLPDAGMTFEIPKITAVPAVAEVAEEGAIGETGMTSSFITVNVKKFAGGQEFSVELLDRGAEHIGLGLGCELHRLNTVLKHPLGFRLWQSLIQRNALNDAGVACCTEQSFPWLTTYTLNVTLGPHAITLNTTRKLIGKIRQVFRCGVGHLIHVHAQVFVDLSAIHL